VVRAAARVNLAAVERNCARLAADLQGGAALGAVVKADGYGHGAVQCARAALAGGATWLCVATADEAAELRAAGLEGPVLVMGALSPEELELALVARADVVAWCEDFVAAVAAAANGRDGEIGVHAKLDTGMGRLGTADPAEARAVADRIAADDALELAGFMTHFATADEPGDEFFGTQLERFRSFLNQVREAHPRALVHAANSAAVFREPDSHFEMARCGIAVYGLDPFHEDASERGLEPALALESYVAAVKPFAPGDSAGYGRTWVAERPTRVGTLPLGYGDGWRRALSNRAEVLIGGRRHPLVGTVSMDNVTVDLGPDTEVQPGEPAVLIGSQLGERISAEEVARRMDTINYEVTCGIARRVPRVHLEG
jgi:alanine racemase